MLTITLLGEEVWDEEASRFRYPEQQVLELEHSLVSLSKWEALHKRPFLGPVPMTEEETADYVMAMILTPNVDKSILYHFTAEDFLAVNDYINDPMTGTTFTDLPGGNEKGETISGELVYYWMNALGIDKEYESWHLNRLFTLIRVHHTKNQKPKKRSRAEIAAENKRLVEERRRRYNSNG